MKRHFLLSVLAVVAAAAPIRAQQPEIPTLPPTVVTPEQPSAPTATGDVPESDLPGAYPDLTRQVFGVGPGVTTGLDSVTRGGQSLFDIPGHGSIVDRQALDEKQSTDMFRALQNEVGVLVQQTARGQSSPFIRGLTGQQVLILVDGVRVNNSIFRAGPNQYFNLIDPGQVDHIEVLRGAQSAMWGADAIGGVINVITRSAASNQGDYRGGRFSEIYSTADSGSYSRLSAEGWRNDGGFFGGASYLNVHDLDRGGDLGRQPFTNYDQYAGDVRYDYLLSCDSMLTVSMSHFEQQDVPRSDRFAPFVFGPPAGTPRPTLFDPQQRDMAYIRLQGNAYNGWFDAYTTTFSYQRNKEGSREIRSATRTDIGEFDVDTLGFNLTLARDFEAYGRLTYGVDYYYDDIASFRNRFNPVTGVTTRDNPQFPDDSRYDRFGGFLNWEVNITQRLLATAGVRYENADASGTINAVSGTRTEFERTYQDWIGSVGLVYEVNSMWHVVGSISEGYRAPNLDDLTADNPVLQNAQDVPSLDVQPEQALTYEIGLKFNSDKLRFQVFEFWTNLDDAILRQAVNGAGVPVPNVIGPNGTPIPGSSNFIRDNFDSYINGTEVAGEYLFDSGWSAYGNFWYTYGQDLERNEPFSRIPPTQGILGLRWREERGRRWIDFYTWLVRHQDRYAAQNNIDARFPVGGTPGYGTLNLRMGTTLDRCDRHRVSLALENLTDRYYRVLGSGVDGAGFNAIIGYDFIR